MMDVRRSHFRFSAYHLALCLVGALFWFLRMGYWLSIHEAPFSDMSDYLSIAKQVWCCFNFNHNPFWWSYKPPGMPLLAAPIVGPTNQTGLDLWRYFVAALTFSSAFWLQHMIFRITKSRLLALFCFGTIALSKSSVFWSYKFSTESLSEAFFYLILAATLWSTDSPLPRTKRFIITGIITMYGVLVRPNMFPVVFIPPLLWLGMSIKRRWALQPVLAKGVIYALTLLLVWAPWLYRGWSLYGTIVPFTTQGPYSYIWEAQGIQFNDPDRGPRVANAEELLNEAPQRFRNDAEAAEVADIAGEAWKESLGTEKYLTLLWDRALYSVSSPEVELTHVSRTTLFSDWREYLLIDKSIALIIAGLLGGIMLAILTDFRLSSIPLSVISVWCLSLLFLRSPRLVEPMLPLILFGVAAIPIMLLNKIASKR